MGLDMYLSRKRYVQNWDHQKDHKYEVTLKHNGEVIPLDNVTHVVEQVAYWRKANAVHQFFVNLNGGRDECEPQYVEVENLVELLRRCRAILADHSLAPQLLPTQSGFFFGGTDYDEWYFEDIASTVKMLEPLVIEVPDADYWKAAPREYEYRASW